MDIRLTTEQRQVMSQRMVQSANILQMDTQELAAYIRTQELENPLIELAEPEPVSQENSVLRRLEWLNSTDEQNRVYTRVDYEEEERRDPWNTAAEESHSLADTVLAQLVPAFRTPRDQEILHYLAHSLDSRGYLEESSGDLAVRFHLTPAEAQRYISLLQSTEPAGVGARDLKECLLLQLTRLRNSTDTAKKIVQDHLEDMGKNRIPRIAAALSLPQEEILDACRLIKSLNPKPGSGFYTREKVTYIQPDVIVVCFPGSFDILLNNADIPGISLNATYVRMLREDASREAAEYLSQKMKQAQWLIRCIQQREDTLRAVTHAIVTHQIDFFKQGIGHLHPLTLAQIAQDIGRHESTVSRCIKGKYLQSSWGVFPMNYFFTHQLSVAAEETTDTATPERIRQEIQRIIDAEDKKKPASDQKISDLLKAAGFEAARRTVAKYREQLGIPGASQRKQW